MVSRLGIKPRTRRLRVESEPQNRQRLELFHRFTLHGVTSGSTVTQLGRNRWRSGQPGPQDGYEALPLLQQALHQ